MILIKNKMIKLKRKEVIIAWYYSCDNSIVNEINDIIKKINLSKLYDEEYSVRVEGSELIITHIFETSSTNIICYKGDYILFDENNDEKLIVCNKEYLNRYEKF